MKDVATRFESLGIENAPGQEVMAESGLVDLRGERITETAVDFSHGDVDAFGPLPGSLDAFVKGYHLGSKQAYTEYRGKGLIREDIAMKLSDFTGTTIQPNRDIIITPGTQGALFLAIGAMVGPGEKVAIVEPDYFANRKLVDFFRGNKVPVALHYEEKEGEAGLDLIQLEKAFQSGVKLFVFSNPNNPVGVIYSSEEIYHIAFLARKYNVALVVDQLYSRQIFEDRTYTHLCAQREAPDNLITIIGPSKTESLSGFRLGIAFGTRAIIDRMEKLQAIVSLRAPGYCQSVLQAWFFEPEGFMEQRIAAHQRIRDGIMSKLHEVEGVCARLTEGGSYLFVKVPELNVTIKEFTQAVRELAGVTVTPGTEFGPQFTSHFRINFSQDEKSAIAAIEKVLSVLERYRKK